MSEPDIQTQSPGKSDKPWLQDSYWASGEIRDRRRESFWPLFFFTFLWNLVAVPSTYTAFKYNDIRENYGLYVMLIFPAIGLFFVFGLLRQIWRQHKIGNSIFRMTHLPGVIGGSLQGTIEIPHKIHPVNGFRLSLKCVNRVQTGGRRNLKINKTVLWEDELRQVLPLQDANSALLQIPVRFTIPGNCPPTDWKDFNNRITWQFEAETELQNGSNYTCCFEVPVFITTDSVMNEKAIRPEIPGRTETPSNVSANLKPIPTKIYNGWAYFVSFCLFVFVCVDWEELFLLVEKGDKLPPLLPTVIIALACWGLIHVPLCWLKKAQAWTLLLVSAAIWFWISSDQVTPLYLLPGDSLVFESDSFVILLAAFCLRDTQAPFFLPDINEIHRLVTRLEVRDHKVLLHLISGTAISIEKKFQVYVRFDRCVMELGEDGEYHSPDPLVIVSHSSASNHDDPDSFTLHWNDAENKQMSAFFSMQRFVDPKDYHEILTALQMLSAERRSDKGREKNA